MGRKPPRLALLLLRFWLSSPSYEAVAGDLCEEYQDGKRTPRWFWEQTFSTIQPLWAPPLWSAVNPMRITRGAGLATIRQDLSYAMRTLRKAPGFTAVVISAIALGIGINTGVFTMLNAIALRPIPVRDADRVISIYQILQGNVSRHVRGTESLFSISEWKQYQAENEVLSGLTAYAPVDVTFTTETGSLLHGDIVTCNYFSVLERQPSIGRGFSDSECRAERISPVVVLSDHVWRTRFGANAHVLGRVVHLNRVAFTVIGVAPPGFVGAGTESSEFWAPVTMQPDLINVGAGVSFLNETNMSWLDMLGRLKPGVSLTQARANLLLTAARIDRLHPGRTTRLAVETATLLGDPDDRQPMLSASYIILAGVSLVLLIACANVANLLLARAVFRHREIAVRLSVGASRGRIIRQLLTESMVLAFVGGTLGTALAIWSCEEGFRWVSTHAVVRNMPQVALNLKPDLHILLYTVSLCLLTGLVFGLLPALESTRLDLNSGLRDEFVLAGRRSRAWLRGVLVGAQVAVCLVVLIAAGLLARGLHAAQNIDPGFNTHGVLAASFDLRREGYDDARTTAFKTELLERVRGFAGEANASFSFAPPLSSMGWGEGIKLEGSVRGKGHATMLDAVSPQFFKLLELPIVAGRGFDERDVAAGAKVAVISESGARKLWPRQDPIGKRVLIGDDQAYTEIVGVVHDAYLTDLKRIREIVTFVPATISEPGFTLLIKSPDIGAADRALRSVVTGIDPKLYYDVSSIDEWRKTQEMPSRVVTWLAIFLGALSLLLACSGIYGVVNYSANHRVKEIGIRMTLGARPDEVLGMMMRQSLWPVVCGAAVGVAGAAGATRLLSSLLYGVSPFDVWTFGGVLLLIISAAFVATFGPARRATRIDPATALRYE